MCTVIFIASLAFAHPAFDWEGPWPGDYVWEECFGIPQGDSSDVRIVRSGGSHGAVSALGKGELSTTISISVRVHEWRSVSVRDNEVSLRVNRPGHYQDWLTVACITSNGPFTLQEVLPEVTTAYDWSADAYLRKEIRYAWREKGGEWNLNLPSSNQQFTGTVQVVILLEIEVDEIPSEFSFKEIMFTIG